MAGWDGAGNFTINYIWTQDAANGIKILASKQDTQWATVVAGLMNCQTRDGQNKPSANWDFNGFKITNLGAPALPTDAARLQDIVATPASEWLSQSTPFAFVGATQFKCTGIDLTARYEIGRRLKITHNTGATTSYYTVVSSVFAAGDTTVTVSGPTLVTTITAISYAMLDAANPSVPVFSAAAIFSDTGGPLLVSGTDYVIGATTTFPSTTVTGDIYGELSAGTFTAKYTGLYYVTSVCSIGNIVPGNVLSGKIQILKNGAAVRANTPGVFGRANLYASPLAAASVSDIVSANAGDTLQVKTNSITFTGQWQNVASTATFQRVR